MKGKINWVIPDGYIPEASEGSLVSHEAICILNTNSEMAELKISIYFEDCEPLEGFTIRCLGKRTLHQRMDILSNHVGEKIPTGLPFAISVTSTIPVFVQYSRMDTGQSQLALMTTMGFSY